jgi:hypothetical protein
MTGKDIIIRDPILLDGMRMKGDLYLIKQVKKQQHYKKKKDKENENKTKYIAPWGG